MNRTIVSLAAVGLFLGCGVSKSQLDAKALEAERAGERRSQSRGTAFVSTDAEAQSAPVNMPMPPGERWLALPSAESELPPRSMMLTFCSYGSPPPMASGTSSSGWTP